MAVVTFKGTYVLQRTSTRQHPPTSAVTYRPATACGTYGRQHSSAFSVFRHRTDFPKRGLLFVIQAVYLPSGTRFLGQYSKAPRSQFSNLDL